MEKNSTLARYERNHSLDHLFEPKTLEFKSKPKKGDDEDSNDYTEDDQLLDENGLKTIIRPAAVCTDIKELVYSTMMMRNMTPDNTAIKVGADDGQGILKITLQLLTKDKVEKEEERAKYSQVIRAKIKFLNYLNIDKK